MAAALAGFAQLVRKRGVHVRQPRLAGQLLNLRRGRRRRQSARVHASQGVPACRRAPVAGRAPSASAASACAATAPARRRALRRRQRRQAGRKAPKSCQPVEPAPRPRPRPRRRRRPPARASCRRQPRGPCTWTGSSPRAAPAAAAGARQTVLKSRGRRGGTAPPRRRPSPHRAVARPVAGLAALEARLAAAAQLRANTLRARHACLRAAGRWRARTCLPPPSVLPPVAAIKTRGAASVVS